MPPRSPRPHLFAIALLGWLLGSATARLTAQVGPLPAVETVVFEGRVVDMRGEGVPLANVWIVPRLAPDQVLARSVADGEGYFRVGKVPKREGLQTRASADGFCTAEFQRRAA